MSNARLAGKVGLFVVGALVALAAMLLIFSKGLNIFTPSYDLYLKAPSVGGLKAGAAVLYSGVTIGNVMSADLAPDGRGVLIHLKIKEKYQVHDDARFSIEQVGFLGDQFVAIYPMENKGPILQSGQTIGAKESFNFQEVGRSATDLIAQFSETLDTVNRAMTRVERTVLSDSTLTNVTVALTNFRIVPDRAVAMIDGVNRLVDTNSPPISISVSNLVKFSEELDKLAAEMAQTVATNRIELTKGVQNLEKTTAVLERLANNVEAGQGLAGMLIKDEEVKFNLSNMVVNFTTLSSNLNKFGLLYKPKQPKTSQPPRGGFPGRSPF